MEVAFFVHGVGDLFLDPQVFGKLLLHAAPDVRRFCMLWCTSIGAAQFLKNGQQFRVFRTARDRPFERCRRFGKLPCLIQSASERPHDQRIVGPLSFCGAQNVGGLSIVPALKFDEAQDGGRNTVRFRRTRFPQRHHEFVERASFQVKLIHPIQRCPGARSLPQQLQKPFLCPQNLRIVFGSSGLQQFIRMTTQMGRHFNAEDQPDRQSPDHHPALHGSAPSNHSAPTYRPSGRSLRWLHIQQGRVGRTCGRCRRCGIRRAARIPACRHPETKRDLSEIHA